MAARYARDGPCAAILGRLLPQRTSRDARTGTGAVRRPASACAPSLEEGIDFARLKLKEPWASHFLGQHARGLLQCGAGTEAVAAETGIWRGILYTWRSRARRRTRRGG